MGFRSGDVIETPVSAKHMSHRFVLRLFISLSQRLALFKHHTRTIAAPVTH
jgi:hypothetical protein